MAMSFKPVLMLVFWFTTPVIILAQSIRHFDVSYTPTLLAITVPGDKLKRHQWGHQAAFELSVSKSPRFSFKAGIGYSFLQAEYKNDIASTGISIQTWYRYYDLIFPFHLRYGFSNNANRFYATAGIIPSINIGRKALEYRPSYGSLGRDVTADQYFTRLDFPLSAGFGYSLNWKDFGHIYIQPTMRTNYGTQFYYLLRYLFGRRNSTNDDPPGWWSIGCALGFAW
jgi:hypothetical protein